MAHRPFIAKTKAKPNDRTPQKTGRPKLFDLRHTKTVTTDPTAVATQLATDGVLGMSDAPNMAAIINGPNTLSHVGKRASVLLALCLLK